MFHRAFGRPPQPWAALDLHVNLISGMDGPLRYVDFERCVPYFAETGGCAICIEVCPWSEPGRGPAISQAALAKRSRETRGASLIFAAA